MSLHNKLARQGHQSLLVLIGSNVEKEYMGTQRCGNLPWSRRTQAFRKAGYTLPVSQEPSFLVG
jgi:hypothetical protein